MNQAKIKNILLAAGAMNIGAVLLFSRFFTNSVINEADPVVMSNFGLVMIVVWGFAYLGAATVNANIKYIAGAFALEKLVYVVVWVHWISTNALAPVYEADLMAGVFFTIYGINDLAFMVLFFMIFKSKFDIKSDR
ncbi:MAG: hypothetical protein ACPG5L_07750 [Vibrio gallaecicus]|uniref:Hydrogenase n=1 Tax=Vibrio gallaecicus TaxID=552386 RepID=A0ABV4NBU1_9VIBR|nr:hypothetical protein [Vibrio gallaecicus]MDN3616436.1 hypothetical protein [Vibrio gallaecicus]